jgi:hypothetical protein
LANSGCGLAIVVSALKLNANKNENKRKRRDNPEPSVKGHICSIAIEASDLLSRYQSQTR